MRAAMIALLYFLPAAATPAERAAALIERGVELYRGGNYREAGEKFLEAHALIDRPVQLRNAAKAFEEAGDDERAIELWTRFQSLPALSKDDRAEAKAHLDLIHAKQREATARAETKAAREEADAARREAERAKLALAKAEEEAQVLASRTEAELLIQSRVEDRAGEGDSPIASYVFFGAGGSFAISSLIVFLVAKSDEAELDDQLSMRMNGLITGTTYQGKNDAVAKIRTERTISAALLGAGVAAIGAGLLTFFWPVGEDEPSVALTPSADGAAFIYQSRF